MRENRTYGSEGGEAGNAAFPTPIQVCRNWRVTFSGRGVYQGV